MTDTQSLSTIVTRSAQPAGWATDARERITRDLVRQAAIASGPARAGLIERALRLNLPLAREAARKQARTSAEEERLYLAAVGQLRRLVVFYDTESETDFRSLVEAALEQGLARHRLVRIP